MAAVSSSSLIPPKSLQERADFLLRNLDQLKPLGDQLKLLPPGTVHGLTGHTQGDFSLTMDFALKNFPLLQKISALVATLGLGGAYRELNLCPDTPEGNHKLSRAEAFQHKVSELTEGIISTNNLNACRVFRMRLQAFICKVEEHNLTKTPVRMDQGHLIKMKSAKIFKAYETHMDGILRLLDLFLKGSGDPADLARELTNAVGLIEKLKSGQTNLPQNLTQDYRDAQTMLELLCEAVLEPDLLMPILLQPLQRSSLHLESEMDVHNFHPKTMVWAEEFLMAFKASHTRCFDVVEKWTKENNCFTPKIKQAKADSTALIEEIESQIKVYTQAFQLVRQFEALSLEEQNSLQTQLKSLMEIEKAGFSKKKSQHPLHQALNELRQTPEGKTLKPAQLAFLHALNAFCVHLPATATSQEIEDSALSIRAKDRMETLKLRLQSLPARLAQSYDRVHGSVKTMIKQLPDVPYNSTEKDGLTVKEKIIFTFDRGYRDDFHHCRMLLEMMGESLIKTYTSYETIHENLNQMLSDPFKRMEGVLLADLLHVEESRLFFALNALIEQKKIPDSDVLGKDLNTMHGQFELAFTRMRNFYQTHQNRPKRPLEEQKEDLAVAEAIKAIPIAKLRTKYSQPEILPTLAFYEKLAALLGCAFTLDTWPKLLKFSPFAASASHPRAEREFFLNLFRVQLSRFQKIDIFQGPKLLKLLQGSLKNEKEKAILQGYETKILQSLAPIVRLQQKLRARPALTLDNLDAEADYFQTQVSLSFTRMQELLNRSFLPLLEYLEEEGTCSSTFLQICNDLDGLRDCFDSAVIDPAKPLFSYLNVQRWLRAEEKVKRNKVKAQLETAQTQQMDEEQKTEEIVEPKAVSKPSTLSLLPTGSLEQTWSKFQAFCKRLPFITCGFTASTEQAMRLNNLQAEAAKHLHDSLPSLQELLTTVGRYGEKPFFINALYLKLAAAMEQAGQLSLAATHCLPVRNDSGHRLMMEKGAESYWKYHSLLSLCEQLEDQNGKVHLESSQKAWLKKLDRVIAITSRRPASGFDEMADELDASLYDPPGTEEKRTAKCQAAADKFKEGLQICMSLLSPVVTDEAELAPSEPFSEKIFEKPQEVQSNPARPHKVLKTFEERLSRIQALRLSQENRRVIPVAADESTLPSRKGTIETCLMNLQAHLGLCRSILEAGNDPSVCLLLTEQALLMQATMLEEALLILCSYFPIRAANGGHNLWQEIHGKPLRYCHALSTYVKQMGNLPGKDAVFAHKMQLWANDLESYLRNSYRYYRSDPSTAGILREKMRNLSRLRQQGAGPELDARLGSNSPETRKAALDSHISKLLQTEVQDNLLNLLEHVNELLGVYEEQLMQK